VRTLCQDSHRTGIYMGCVWTTILRPLPSSHVSCYTGGGIFSASGPPPRLGWGLVNRHLNGRRETPWVQRGATSIPGGMTKYANGEYFQVYFSLWTQEGKEALFTAQLGNRECFGVRPFYTQLSQKAVSPGDGGTVARRRSVNSCRGRVGRPVSEDDVIVVADSPDEEELEGQADSPADLEGKADSPEVLGDKGLEPVETVAAEQGGVGRSFIAAVESPDLLSPLDRYPWSSSSVIDPTTDEGAGFKRGPWLGGGAGP